MVKTKIDVVFIRSLNETFLSPGEHPAAMQQGCAKSALDRATFIFSTIIALYMVDRPNLTTFQFET